MVADYLRFHMRGVDVEVLAEMDAKPLTVEVGAGAQHGSLRAGHARHVGQRIRWVRHDQQHRFGLGGHDLRHDLAIDLGVRV